MKPLRFEGYSDDAFGEYGRTNVDHDNCASGEPIQFRVVDSDTDQGLIVVGQYAPGAAGGWLIGVAPYDPESNDEPIPEWPMRFERGDRDYSPVLIIEAPDGVEVDYCE